jgi:hypothetical protein
VLGVDATSETTRVLVAACDAHIAHRCGSSLPLTAATANDRGDLLCVCHAGQNQDMNACFLSAFRPT